MAAGPPRRVQLSRRKGWRLPPHTTTVARPTRWGNPFTIDAELARGARDTAQARKRAVARYRRWIQSQAGLRRLVRLDLAGKNLACWCPLDGPCHADVLLAIANRTRRRTTGEGT